MFLFACSSLVFEMSDDSQEIFTGNGKNILQDDNSLCGFHQMIHASCSSTSNPHV